MHSLHLLLSILERGLLFSLVATGVFITSRLIKFDDLTTEGSFGLGGAVMALLINAHCNDLLALLGAVAAGMLCGLVTGLLHTRLHMNKLMSGIITTSALFSIILTIIGPHASLSATPLSTMVTRTPGSFFIICLCLVVLVHGALAWLRATQYGLLLDAVGINESMVRLVGKHPAHYKLLALCCGNALSALTGALFAWHAGYFSAWSSVGILIMALASVLLGEALAVKGALAAVAGSIIYQLLMSLTLELNIAPELNRLVTAALIVILIASKRWITPSAQERA